MERNNDALAMVAGFGKLTNEAFSRPVVSFDNPEAVAKYIVPAVREKIEILDSMEIEQNEIGEPQSKVFKIIYHNFTNALRVMKERAQLQYIGFTAFANNESTEIDMNQLDSAELEAVDKAILSLNNAVGSLGLSGDEFLKINCDAFNSVRKNIGLSPLSNQQFQEIYFAGISGEPARFFNLK